jgi:hypothetical protein
MEADMKNGVYYILLKDVYGGEIIDHIYYLEGYKLWFSSTSSMHMEKDLFEKKYYKWTYLGEL